MWQQHFASPNAPRSLRAETLWLLSELMLEKSHPVSRVREAINLLRSDEDISWEKAVHTVCASRTAAVPCLAIPLSAPAMFDAQSQFDVFPTALTLRRVDPARNMRRFYMLTVQPDLFGGASLIREWGRIGSRGQSLIEHHSDEGLAITALLKRAATKRKRGYTI